MTDAVKSLFELLTKKEKSGSDYTGTVTRVDGKTAYVRFSGAEIADTPVSLSIGAKAGDSVRIRVADGRAWIVGNDTAPPNDSSEVAHGLAQTNAGLTATATQLSGLSQSYAVFNTVVTQELMAHQAVIDDLNVTYANITLANIDTANINTAKVRDLFTEVGLIRDAVISDAKITGYLDAVKINAASIDAGTLSVDRLVIRGDNTSLVYAINNISGALQSQNVNTINGEVLTDRTILADKIVAHSITANEITASNIVGSGGWINLAQGTFNYGNMLVWNGSALTVNGKITSSDGRIGGWDIGQNILSNTNSSGNAVILANGSDAYQNAFYVRNGAGTTASPYTYPIILRANGDLIATKATITGSVTATSGKIGAFDISGNSLKNGTYIDLSAYDSSIAGARLQLGPGNGAHASFTSGGIVIFDANGANSYMYPTQLYIAGTITSYGAISTSGGITSYRTIQTNEANIVAVGTGDVFNYAQNNTSSCYIACRAESGGTHGIYSNGYFDGHSFAAGGRYLIYRSTSNNTIIPSKLYTQNEGYSANRPVIGTNEGGNAIGVIVSNSASVGFYGRWDGVSTAAMSGRTIACPSSDIRLKENIADSTVDALSVINAIRIRQFDWKDEARGHWDCGMVVDEMERDIDPNFCIGGGDDGEGHESYKSVNTFYLQGYEVKAIQELSKRIEELERRLAS